MVIYTGIDLLILTILNKLLKKIKKHHYKCGAFILVVPAGNSSVQALLSPCPSPLERHMAGEPCLRPKTQ